MGRTRQRSKKERRPDVGAEKIATAIACTYCGAGTGERCWNNAHGRQITGVHWQRRKDYDRARGKLPKLRGDVTVRYACPLCGGPHARADHPTTGASTR